MHSLVYQIVYQTGSTGFEPAISCVTGMRVGPSYTTTPSNYLWGPVRLHKMKGAPMPPHPALALAEPEVRLASSFEPDPLSADRQGRVGRRE